MNAETVQFKIEAGIPVPPHPRGLARKSKYPFGVMNVGDSFVVPSGTIKKLSLWAIISRYQREHRGTKFTSRAVDGGIRVWRIA